MSRNKRFYLYENLWSQSLRDDDIDVQYNNIYNNILFNRWHTAVNEQLMAPGYTVVTTKRLGEIRFSKQVHNARPPKADLDDSS